MTKKKSKVPQEKPWTPSKKQLITISIILVSIIALASLLSFLFSPKSEAAFSLNAAIVDQLGKEFPNPTFVNNATDILKSKGFSVTHYNKTLDVGFFEGLAKYNYGMIILRAHSALREDNSTVDLFTSEEFSDYKYRQKLEDGYLTKGEIFYEPPPRKYYFAITSRFVENLEGRFPKSIVIAMGCWSLKPKAEQLANAFIAKGARAYIGWTDLVLLTDTDNETLRLLSMLLNENKTVAEAISQTHPYPYTGGNKTILSRMNSYPTTAGNLRISELIAEAKTQSALTTGSFNSFNVAPVACIINALVPAKKCMTPRHIKC